MSIFLKAVLRIFVFLYLNWNLMVVGVLLFPGINLFDLSSHFAPHLVFFGVLLITVAFYNRLRLISILLILFICLNIFFLKDTYSFQKAEDSFYESSSLTVMTLNTLYTNQNSHELINKIQTLNPDIIHFQELPSHLANSLKELSNQLPYCSLHDEPSGPLGLGVCSRFPIESERITYIGEGTENTWPVQTYKINFKGQPIQFINTHLVPPFVSSKNRNIQIQQLLYQISDSKENYKILTGDFNLTTYSPIYHKFFDGYEMQNTRTNGLIGTWPAKLPAFLRIPIDHIFTTKNFEVVESFSLVIKDSDHLALISKLKLKKP